MAPSIQFRTKITKKEAIPSWQIFLAGEKMFYKEYNNENKEDIYYKIYRKKKKSGEYREICAPSEILKRYQKEVQLQLERYPINKNAIGFKKKSHLLAGPIRHKNCSTICNMDIQDFFPSITVGIFKEHILKDDVLAELIGNNIETFIEIVFRDGRLPQGSPASPILSNIIMAPFDRYIEESLTKLNEENPGAKLVYTRYADDITVSSRMQDFDMSIIANLIRDGIKELKGFKIKEKKTLIGTKQLKITGIPVNAYKRPKGKILEPIELDFSSLKIILMLQIKRDQDAGGGFLKDNQNIGFIRSNYKTRQSAREHLISIQKKREPLSFGFLQKSAGLLAHILDVNAYYAFSYLKMSIQIYLQLLEEQSILLQAFQDMILRKVIKAVLTYSELKPSSKIILIPKKRPIFEIKDEQAVRVTTTLFEAFSSKKLQWKSDFIQDLIDQLNLDSRISL